MEELFGELIGQAFMAVVFTAIGFGYLYLRYRNTVQVQQVLVRKYENSYANAGMAVVLNVAAATFILLIIGLLVAPLLHWLRGLGSFSS
ncbi:hypothetical protein [Hymenobacter ruricola]|uniref:Uncharacterized protein n=1 Tax=Hymenobacter ruricola TaxID=2791023 RepID=A0ABS0I1N3_9BACT|nr:hypothetical protein [Hymenobacter ruricola]MBF9220856.1 hypothetical protein [Hymenobacter ruricola]